MTMSSNVEMVEAKDHPMDYLIRKERLPHVWCPGCGLGSILSSFVNAVAESGIDPDKTTVVSGIGCAGRASGYINLDVFHTTHGRAIPFATGLKLGNPDLNLVVFSGDGDLFAIGGNHFIHAARRNISMTVICSNNFNYGMTGGQVAPSTPLECVATTAPYGNLEKPFNLSYLAAAAGASFVARWTSLHVRRLTDSINKALTRKGFSFIEVISPCPTTFGRRNTYETGLKMMQMFQDKCVVKNGLDPQFADIEFGEPLMIGEFVDKPAPLTLEDMERRLQERGGHQ